MKLDLNRTLYFSDVVKGETIKKLDEDLMTLIKADPKLPVMIRLTTGGGEVSSGFAFYDTVTSLLKGHAINTMACGLVASTGVIMFLAGKERFITRNSSLFLHEMANNYDKPVRLGRSTLQKTHKMVSFEHNNYVAICHHRSGGKLTKKVIEKMMSEETRLSAKEAVKYGLADRII